MTVDSDRSLKMPLGGEIEMIFLAQWDAFSSYVHIKGVLFYKKANRG